MYCYCKLVFKDIKCKRYLRGLLFDNMGMFKVWWMLEVIVFFLVCIFGMEIGKKVMKVYVVM